jgi:hypothetical protein
VDAFLDLVTPPLVNLVGAIILGTLLTGVLAVTAVPGAFVFLGYWGILLGLSATHVLVGLAAAGADRGLYRTLWTVPQYAFWKLRLYMKFTRRGRSDEWVRTTREP